MALKSSNKVDTNVYEIEVTGLPLMIYSGLQGQHI